VEERAETGGGTDDLLFLRHEHGHRHRVVRRLRLHLQSGLRIRIRIQEGKNDPFKVENFLKFMFLSVGWPLLRSEGFFLNLDVLYEGLGIGKL
jgi:hypothetical protein